MSVPSSEEALATVEANGETVVQGRTPIPGMGYFATCRDTERNEEGVSHQRRKRHDVTVSQPVRWA